MEPVTAEDGVRIPGSQTTAKVMGLSIEDLEGDVIQQISETIDSGAYSNQVRVMPDTHWGAGAPIGFTVPVDTDPLRVVPNTVGVDVGCGMRAENYGQLDLDEETLEGFDDQIRDAVPMGRSVHSHADNDYHLIDDFPWDACERKLAQFQENVLETDYDLPEWFDGYGKAYVDDLTSRVEYDQTRLINSIGTLGGGNHFIEFNEEQTLRRDDGDGHIWCVLHSGSRGIGLSIAQYWQAQATAERTRDWIVSTIDEALESYIVPDLDDPELIQWFEGGKGQSYIDSEQIKADVNNNYLVGYLHDQIREAHPQNRDSNEDLDYLEGASAMGYVIDMIFGQTFAQENRRRMHELIRQTLGLEVEETVESVHNYVDFEDGILRKGACRAHEDEMVIVPLDMANGTLLCRGQGNDDWNMSACHGAGRVMSRTQAFDVVDMDAFELAMDDVVSSSVTEETKDEAPTAYKDAHMIKDAIEPTAAVVSALQPILNIKSLE